MPRSSSKAHHEFFRGTVMTIHRIAAVGAASVLSCVVAATAAQSQVRTTGATTTLALPSQTSQLGAQIDFANAKPMRMPAANVAAPSPAKAMASALDPLEIFGRPGAEDGGSGTGEQTPVRLAARQDIPQGSGIEPEEFGTSAQPYTTSRAKAMGDMTTNYYPYRAAGKLFFKIGANSFLCSASLIKPGIVVTAAHCVANYGQSQFYSGWTFVPAYNNGSAPYGTWTAASATILTKYYNGTDSCAQFGVICPDDVALLTLNSQSGSYAGNSAGWFGYGWDGYGFNASSQALITQLGYPVALDGGLLMERNDSQGFVAPSLSNNTIIGSLMTGGSSGGPWLVNFGLPPSLSGISFGSAASHNIVVGVTSWGYTDTSVKQQGASPFTSGNIVKLVTRVCTATPAAC
jgi:V8-like Glu-specific endopeptidase